VPSSVDVDVVYVDPLTGDTVQSGNSGEKAASTTRAHCIRHRSLLIDPETMSLPPHPLGPVGDRAVGLPVASATFTGICLSDWLADRLADVLLRHRSFRIVTFVKCHRVDACLFRIRQTLVGDRKCNAGSKLSRLHVRLSHVDDVGVVAELAEVLSHSLHSLSLTGCSIMSIGCATVVRSLLTGSRRILELDLGFNDVAEVGALSDALAANCSLRCLRLKGNAIGWAGAASLFGSLRQNYRLELLDLSGNPIGERLKSDGDDLWRTVAEALLSNRTLRELKLERCMLGVEACSSLGRVLAVNSTLRVLDVSMNQSVGDLGVALLANGLRRNRRSGIRTLALNMCAVGNVGFRSLLVAVKDGGATGLRHVKLCYNRINSKEQPQMMWWRQEPRTTEGRQRSSLRPRPSSAHFDLHFQEASRLQLMSDIPGNITLESYCDRDVLSSTPITRPGSSADDRCPLYSILMSDNLLVESTNQHNQSMTLNNASDSDAGLVNRSVESDTMTVQAMIFNGANHRPVLASTPTTSQQLRTDVDRVCNRSATEELPALSQWPDLLRGAINSRTDSVRRADSDRRSSENFRGVTPNSSLFPAPTTDDDSDVDDNREDIYDLLCRVLRANPQLKVLLWGNQQWYSGGGIASKTAELDADIAEAVMDSSAVSCSTVETTSNRLDGSRTLYATLPRNHQFI